MKKAYEQAVQSHANVHGAPDEVQQVEVSASKRQRVDNPYACSAPAIQSSSAYGAGGNVQSAEQIRDAYKALRGGGSTLDTMGAVAGIVADQRKRGFR